MLFAAIHNAGLVTIPYTPHPISFLKKILNRPDNEAPVITLIGSGAIITIEGCSDPYVEQGATVTDNCNTGPLMIGGDTVDVDTPGEYTVTYNVTDENGNAATEVIRTVKVVDSTNPTVIAKPLTLQLDLFGNL